MREGSEESVLDRELALTRVGGDRQLLHEVAQLFLDNEAEMVNELRVAVAARDAQAVERAAHSLKGTVVNFGARPAFDASTRLERMGREGQLAGADEALASLEQAMERLTTEMRELFEENS